MGPNTIGIEIQKPVISQAIPRHREIKERLAKRIIKLLQHDGDNG